MGMKLQAMRKLNAKVPIGHPISGDPLEPWNNFPKKLGAAAIIHILRIAWNVHEIKRGILRL